MITIVEYDKERKDLKLHENVNWREFQMDPTHLYWWDFVHSTPEENLSLSEIFHFHPLSIEDCLGDVHHPKVDFYDAYLYIILHGVDVDRSLEEGFSPKEYDIFLGKNYLVTFHKKEARSTSEVLRRCKENTPIFDYGIDFVLYSILDVLVTNYMPVLEQIEDDIDDIEEALFANPGPEVQKRILRLKRTLIRLKRTVFPQREVMNHLARNEYEFISHRTQIYFRDIYDMLYRIAEMTESFRDVTTAMVETYLSTVSNRLNEIMKVLTMFATVFGTLTVIAGIYGMNFRFMPELDWRYGYYFALGIMVISVLAMFSFFRWKKWL